MSNLVIHYMYFSVPTNDVEAPSEPRCITTDQTVQGLGLNILGGNATGIFVCDVKSPGNDLGIRIGDQILEVGIFRDCFRGQLDSKNIYVSIDSKF